jgi:hypothetical protein
MELDSVTRVEITNTVGQPPVCHVWVGGVLRFVGPGCGYAPSGMDEFAELCSTAREYREKWSRVVAEKVALEAEVENLRLDLSESRDEAQVRIAELQAELRGPR